MGICSRDILSSLLHSLLFFCFCTETMSHLVLSQLQYVPHAPLSTNLRPAYHFLPAKNSMNGNITSFYLVCLPICLLSFSKLYKLSIWSLTCSIFVSKHGLMEYALTWHFKSDPNGILLFSSILPFIE